MIQQEEFVTAKKQLKKELEHDRYQHSLSVAFTSCALAMRYGENLDDAYIAGLLHDCAKSIPDQERVGLAAKWGIEVSAVEKRNPALLHAKLGAVIARQKYGVTDKNILNAICYHTVGRPGMSVLEKIVFVADYIEPYRFKAPDLPEIRRIAFEDLNMAVMKISEDTYEYVMSTDPDEIDPTTEVVRLYYKKLVEHKS